MLKLFFSLFIMVFISCSSAKNTTKQEQQNDIVITMQKTPCYGRCPVYEITINGDGSSKFVGRRFVDSIGVFEKQFSQVEVNSLVKAFEEAKFFEMQDEYTSKVSDMSTTYVSFSVNGKTKRIKDYYNAPAELKELEKMIEKLAFTPGWKKLNESK